MVLDLQALRTALVITLTILLVIILFRRFRDRVMKKDRPAASHVELLALTVAYHPARLCIDISLPRAQQVHGRLLDLEHHELHRWEPVEMAPGGHVLELALVDVRDGAYYFEMSTSSQRTLRRFRLEQG
ncbi:MAG: hypothetical protein KDB88_00330 [Flavobacteriales bacterium]|nr:hypothetical protein [Flavobacteriales bacterium]